ncbi:MAG: cytochrome c3 family protein [Planctomycetota bacterium]|jgi:hypothetical protein
MRIRVIIIVLILGIAIVSLSLVSALARVNLFGNNEGYRPEQPLTYSHRIHAGELSIPCLYCHPGAERSRHAGIPSPSMCMNCHKYVTAALGAIREEERVAEEEGRDPQPVIAPELQKLYDAESSGKPIVWTKVHRLPDFAYFDHRPHVAANVACQTCHGPIESMDRVRQVSSLTMGWCVSCHRKTGGTRLAGKPVDPSLDCVTCHF